MESFVERGKNGNLKCTQLAIKRKLQTWLRKHRSKTKQNKTKKSAETQRVSFMAQQSFN